MKGFLKTIVKENYGEFHSHIIRSGLIIYIYIYIYIEREREREREITNGVSFEKSWTWLTLVQTSWYVNEILPKKLFSFPMKKIPNNIF